MAALDNTQISNILNALTPTSVGTPGFPTAFTAMAAGIMKIRLSLNASTASAAGTEIATQGSGYTNGTGWSLGTTSSTVSSAGGAVGVPFITQSFVSNGSPTAVNSFDLESSAGVRGFWGQFNGFPVNVANLNSFQVVGGSGVAAGIQISLT
jgi:hypothetical protein